MNISLLIAKELQVKPEQVAAAITLLDNGSTVPFISRYRKEATGALDDTQLRKLEERLHYLRELDERRQTVLKSIQEQGKLTPELEKTLLSVDNKASLEDLYLPFKPKRRTKAQIAKEAGLEPLALQLLKDPSLNPLICSESFINAEHSILTPQDALEGARYILMEVFSEDPLLIGLFRTFLWENALLKTEIIKGQEALGDKFLDYFNYEESIKKIPSHRALAILRGQRESILRVNLSLNEAQETECLQKIQKTFFIENLNRPADNWLIETVNWTWRIKIFLKLEIELMTKLKEDAEAEAINVFANNLKHLLLAAPAGSQVTLGLDPGLRTGVKAVVVDGTGKLQSTVTIFPHPPFNKWNESITTLAELCKKFKVELISIGNGTASRETDKLIMDLKKQYPDLILSSLVVSEAGASVYSASETAALEFPQLDVTYRGAVSIARRLQDPLAELVKIDPKAIGVGQYQHDVNQIKLSRTLKSVMEDCVNAVGVDVNTASVPLLVCVAGLNETVAKNIVSFRDEHGAFKNRLQLKKVPRLGEKAFEQAAGFLRIVNGENLLDASAVHPESYSIVSTILSIQHKTLPQLMGNTSLLKTINAKDFITETVGIPTIIDILHELEKPGRDPRPEFKTATFKEGIESLTDLHPDMVLEGVITNVANFGAFVDIGVHQDGLVHKSLLANYFVQDPHKVVKVGDIVTVKVLEIDIKRKRIQLSMRLNATPDKKIPIVNSAPKSSIKKKETKSVDPSTKLGGILLAAISGKSK